MNRDEYQPGSPAEIDVEPDADRWTLVFVRDLAHPPQQVWQALTDPTALMEWSPFDSDRNLDRVGAATLTMAGGDGIEASTAAQVSRAERPQLLEYTWDKDMLQWTLEAKASGTRLTLRHTLTDESWLPKVAAGWHICLDVAERFMAGQPIGRIVGHDALEHGWERLNDAYAKDLQIESTGWPLS